MSNLSLRVEWGGVCGENCSWPNEAASQLGGALRAGETSLPCSVHFAAIMHTSIWSGSKYKGKGKKTHTVNNNINCHQWSEQCYKSLLDHRISMLTNFPFSLKPCVIGRDRGPVCSCPSCMTEAWTGLSLLPPAPHILTAQPDHPEMPT